MRIQRFLSQRIMNTYNNSSLVEVEVKKVKCFLFVKYKIA